MNTPAIEGPRACNKAELPEVIAQRGSIRLRSAGPPDFRQRMAVRKIVETRQLSFFGRLDRSIMRILSR